MRKSDKSFVMTLAILTIIIGCGVHSKMPAKTVPEKLFEQQAIVYHAPKRDTPRVKQIYDPAKINAIIARLPKAMDRLDATSDELHDTRNELKSFMLDQGQFHKQYAVMFEVANSRRKQIATMKADSAAKESQVLQAIKKMSDAAENDRKYKSKIAIEEKIDTNIVLFTCIATMVMGLLSNIGNLVAFWNRLFKKQYYA